MTRTARLLLAATAICILGIVPGTAGAKVVASPTSVLFPDQAVGGKSAPVAVTLTKDCRGAESTLCLPLPNQEGPTFNTSIGVTGDGFSQTNDCPPGLTAAPDSSTSCTINVFFAPKAVGPAVGMLSTGPGGPTVSLKGKGLPAPAVANAKKCKKAKKGSAIAAKKKKCGKKKRKK